MSLSLPDSSDPWVWVEWMLGQEQDLYVRIMWHNPSTRGSTMTLVPVGCLPPDQWVFTTRRIFFDRTFPVLKYEDWRRREQDVGLEPAADMPWEEEPVSYGEVSPEVADQILSLQLREQEAKEAKARKKKPAKKRSRKPADRPSHAT